ncbi:hypothetical protein IW261DRAFT_797744 [Armillaria novae-zelandiae]|uniref:DUF6534 domain-containing protein n=1 Tax=Armillaria novae-zelandiae TaxID=153914 RepID=A0AA39PLC2_9AGAR|nr:hypothetical protein IW261DRAFT_797744 [Armillaria novae-zelandiae]
MPPVPTGYPIERLSGPLIVGYLLHWGLFGTLSVQLYLYYLAFPKDRKSTKCLVYGMYIVEFVQTMFVTHDAFVIFGYGFGDMEAVTGVHFDWLTIPLMSTIAASAGHTFYAYRLAILSKSRIVPAFVICVSLTSGAAAIITGVYAFQEGDFTKVHNSKTSIAVGMWCGCSALCDIVIAICMTYYLMHSHTGFCQTQIVITKLIRLIIETGSVTAVAASLNLILFFVFPQTFVFMTLAIIMPKLYANTVYVVLNSRIRIMGGRDTYTSSSDMSSPTTMIRDIASQSKEGTQRADEVQGQVTVVTITKEAFSNDHETSPAK